MQSTVRGQRRRLRYAAAAGTRTAACGLQCCCWGCIEGLSIAPPPSPRRPPPTFEASKEPTITASRNFLSRLPLHFKLQAYTNSGGGSAISRRHDAAACLQAQWTPLRVLLRPSKHPLWHYHQALTNPPFLQDQYYSEWVPVLVALLRWKHQLLSQRAWIRMFHIEKQHRHAMPYQDEEINRMCKNNTFKMNIKLIYKLHWFNLAYIPSFYCALRECTTHFSFSRFLDLVKGVFSKPSGNRIPHTCHYNLLLV